MPSRNDLQQASTPSLMAGLLSDAKKLAAGHLGHARREMSEEMTNLKLTLIRVMIAVGVGSVGCMLLGHAICAGLIALGLPSWASYFLVAGVAIATAVYLLMRWKPDRKDVDLIPDESIDQLKQDVEDIGDAARH